MPGLTGVNAKTVLLMTTIRELADKTLNGFVPFSKYREISDKDVYDCIVYDDSKDVYPHKNDKDLIYHAYKISALSVGEDDHNTLSTYDDIFEDVTIHVMIDDDDNDDDAFIEVAFGKNGQDGVIVIRGGSYHADYYGN